MPLIKRGSQRRILVPLSHKVLRNEARIVQGERSRVVRPYGYDNAGQLTDLTEYAADGVTVLFRESLKYDLAGRVVSAQETPESLPGVVAAAQSFDRDNRLLLHNGSASSFDRNGNLLGVASGLTPASYTYDGRNRLVAAGNLNYGYDAEGRRISISGSDGTSSLVVNPNSALDQVLVRTGPNGVKTFYVYGIGLLHEETGGEARYYHFNRRGDTVVLTDSSSAAIGRISYGAFGEILTRSGMADTAFLFNGRWGVQTDSNGIYYHRARFYHPVLRRFLNQDPTLGSIASPFSLNRFAYANGEPVSLVDPFGLMAQDAAPNNSAARSSTWVFGAIFLTTDVRDSANMSTEGKTAKEVKEIENNRAIIAAVTGYAKNATRLLNKANIDAKVVGPLYYGSVEQLTDLEKEVLGPSSRYAGAAAHGTFTGDDLDSYTFEVEIGGQRVKKYIWARAFETTAKGINPYMATRPLNCSSVQLEEPYTFYSDLLLYIAQERAKK